MKYSYTMIQNIAAIVIKRLFRLTGLEVHRFRGVRTSMFQALRHLSNKGFNPHTVFDIGVGYGTAGLCESFPNAFFVLIEPVAEFEPYIRQKMRYKYLLIQACAGEKNGTTLLSVGSNLTASSTLIEKTHGEIRTVEEITLDSLCRRYYFHAPFLVKVDVEGSEIRVLRGMSRIMDAVEVIILEVTFIPGRIGGPDFTQIVIEMAKLGFVIFDIVNLRNRNLDESLVQADAVFVRENSPLRS